MTQPELFDSDIRALQQLLRAAWKQLGDPSLTAFTRRELRNQMKQYSADLKVQLEKAPCQPQPVRDSGRTFSNPELRILA
jgi:hypothetical protein